MWGRLLGACLGEEGVGQLLLQRQSVHGHSLWREEGVRQRCAHHWELGHEHLIPGVPTAWQAQQSP